MRKPEYKNRVKEYGKVLRRPGFLDDDFAGLLEIEVIGMKRMIRSFQRNPYHDKSDLRWMKIYLKLVEMYLKDTWWDKDPRYPNRKVNMRNAERFKKQGLVNYPGFLYEEKLWNLICMIKLNYQRTWWI